MPILLSIESIPRELDYKLILAINLVNKNTEVVVSQHNFLNKVASRLPKSIYVGKNFYRYNYDQSQWVNEAEKLRKYGHRLIHIDEESAFYWGKEDEWDRRLELRMDVDDIKQEDVLCVWGDYQKDYYSKKTMSESIHVTGNPRFSFKKKIYQNIFRDEIAAIKSNYGKFILINTSYALSNNAAGNKNTFSRKYYLSNKKEGLKRFSEWWLHSSKMCSEFVYLVINLSLDLPEEFRIVLRPHPSESIDLYKEAFSGLNNVFIDSRWSVTPWLLASDFLISEGCTTCFEAALLNRKVLLYTPFDAGEMEMFLPSLSGKKVRNSREILDIINSDQKFDYLEIARKNNRAIKMLCNIKGIDSFQKLLEIIRKEYSQILKNQSSGKLKKVLIFAKIISIITKPYEFVKNSIRHFFPDKQREYMGFKKIFPGFSQDEIRKKVISYSKSIDKNIKVNFVNDKMFILSSEDD